MITNQEIYLGTPLAWPQLLVHGGTLTSNTLDITAIPGAGQAGKVSIALLWGNEAGTGDSDATTLKLQGSNDNSTFTDIADSIYGTATDVNGNASTLPVHTAQQLFFGWLINTNGGQYRYFKAVLTLGTGSVGMSIAIVCLLGDLSKQIGKPDFAQGYKELLAIPNINPTTH